ncbi:MAG: alpha/beta hydrolase [Terriglobia bacterium]|nr:alpha/beta hydrolase [Terriglobia bacterium]
MKLVIIAIGLVLFVALVFACVIFFRYPMALFNWQNRRALKSAGFVEKSIASPVGKQTVWEKGSGPILVLLHGAGDHAGSWSKVAPQLAESYDVVIPDLAGHGRSDPETGPLTIDTMLSGLDSVISAKAPSQKVIIAGNSLGAWLAFLYAKDHPNKVNRIIAIDGGPIRGERPDLVPLPTNREQAAKLFDAILDPGSPHPPGFVLDDVVRASHNGPIGRMVAAGAADMSKHLLDGKLAAFTTPVDLIWGGSDRLIPLSYAQRMDAELPNVRLTTLPRCGHIPQQECPIALTKTLTDALHQPPPAAKPPLASAASKEENK